MQQRSTLQANTSIPTFRFCCQNKGGITKMFKMYGVKIAVFIRKTDTRTITNSVMFQWQP